MYITSTNLSEARSITTLCYREALLLSTVEEVFTEQNVTSYQVFKAYIPLCSHEESLGDSLVSNNETNMKNFIAQFIIAKQKAQTNNGAEIKSMKTVMT